MKIDNFIFKKSKYITGNLAIVVITTEEGYEEFYGSLTVNIRPLGDTQAALDTNNYPDAENTAKKIGATPTGMVLKSGFCQYPVYDFSDVLDKLEKY